MRLVRSVFLFFVLHPLCGGGICDWSALFVCFLSSTHSVVEEYAIGPLCLFVFCPPPTLWWRNMRLVRSVCLFFLFISFCALRWGALCFWSGLFFCCFLLLFVCLFVCLFF